MAVLVDGRYELIEVIGSGGMATVWRARDIRLERQVALKRPHPVPRDDPRFDRLSREARLAASISHPHLVSVHDAGADVDGLYLIMELVEAPSLAQVGARLQPDQVLEVGMQVSRALAAVHRTGVVHRDVKPGNILLADGGAKLTDFGIASGGTPTIGSEQPTEADPLLATANYAAPEILAGHMATDRSDIFALGVVLYELLAGHAPFFGVDRTRRPATLAGPVGPVLDQCLSPYPEDRPSATALAAELNGALADMRAGAVAASAGFSAPAVVPTGHVDPTLATNPTLAVDPALATNPMLVANPTLASAPAMVPTTTAMAAAAPPYPAPTSPPIGGHDPTATQVMGNRPPMAFGSATPPVGGPPPGPAGIVDRRQPPGRGWIGPAALGLIGLIAVVTVLALLSGALDGSADGADQAIADGEGEPQTSVTVPTDANDDDSGEGQGAEPVVEDEPEAEDVSNTEDENSADDGDGSETDAGDDPDAGKDDEDNGGFGLGGLFDSLGEVEDFFDSVTEKAEEIDATAKDVRDVMKKVEEATEKAGDGKPDEAVKKLEEAAEKVGDRLDGRSRDQLLDLLDDVAEQLDLPDLDLAERFGEDEE